MRTELGKGRYVAVKNFNDDIQVHFRQYERSVMWNLYPTKLGIHLSPTQFATLLHFMKPINAIVEKIRNREKYVSFKFHLGAGIYATANSEFPVVHLRRYFLPDGQTSPLPTKKGISLRLKEWEAFVTQLDDIKNLIDAKPCFYQDDHHSLVTFLICPECNPFKMDFLPNHGF